MEENKEEVMSTKTALITIGIIAVILATAVTILSLTSRKKKESLLVEDIIDLYNHKYNTYEEYVRATRYLIEEFKKRNSETTFEPHDLTIKKSFYIEPVILSKNVFETAYKLGERKEK